MFTSSFSSVGPPRVELGIKKLRVSCLTVGLRTRVALIPTRRHHRCPLFDFQTRLPAFAFRYLLVGPTSGAPGSRTQPAETRRLQR